MGDPKNAWFTRDNPANMDDFRNPPHFWMVRCLVGISFGGIFWKGKVSMNCPFTEYLFREVDPASLNAGRIKCALDFLRADI